MNMPKFSYAPQIEASPHEPEQNASYVLAHHMLGDLLRLHLLIPNTDTAETRAERKDTFPTTFCFKTRSSGFVHTHFIITCSDAPRQTERYVVTPFSRGAFKQLLERLLGPIQIAHVESDEVPGRESIIRELARTVHRPDLACPFRDRY